MSNKFDSEFLADMTGRPPASESALARRLGLREPPSEPPKPQFREEPWTWINADHSDTRGKFVRAGRLFGEGDLMADVSDGGFIYTTPETARLLRMAPTLRKLLSLTTANLRARTQEPGQDKFGSMASLCAEAEAALEIINGANPAPDMPKQEGADAESSMDKEG